MVDYVYQTSEKRNNDTFNGDFFIKPIFHLGPNSFQYLELFSPTSSNNMIGIIIYRKKIKSLKHVKEAPIYFSNIFISFLGLAYFTPLGCPLRG